MTITSPDIPAHDPAESPSSKPLSQPDGQYDLGAVLARDFLMLRSLRIGAVLDDQRAHIAAQVAGLMAEMDQLDAAKKSYIDQAKQ